MKLQELLQEARKKSVELNPNDIVLYRSAKTADGAGGYILGSPAPIAAQRARVYSLKAGAKRGSGIITNGSVVIIKADWAVQFESYPANVQKEDYFTHPASGAKCLVKDVLVMSAAGIAIGNIAFAEEVS